jgi:CDP-paratose 2-epimerase
MKIAIITGSAGLFGGEAVEFLSATFGKVIGIDNNYLMVLSGDNASTSWNQKRISEKFDNYDHHDIDIREGNNLEHIFAEYGSDVQLIVHAAAQPSHDCAAKEPLTDFSINANGTLNLLELTRRYCMSAVFIFTSTNKVDGDRPNSLPIVEMDNRWEIESSHPYYLNGIDESMSIDRSTHSLFGTSKVSADVLCQKYGGYLK